MVSRRVQKRIESEAAEKRAKKGADEPTPKKRKAATKKAVTRKRKTKVAERKRLLWGVFSGTLKEEGRYAYDELDKAQERLEQLRSKSKKLYFIQPIKEVISDSPAPPAEQPAAPADEEEAVVAAAESDDDDDDAQAAADEEE